MKCFDVDGILNLSALGPLGVFQQLRFKQLRLKQLRLKQLRLKQLRLKQTGAKLLSVTLLNTALLMPGGIQAAEVSPAMLLQAQSMSQSMSAAEQEKLAKQFGFDRSQIKGDTGAATELALPAEPLKQAQQVEVLAPNPQRLRFGEDLFNHKVSSFSVTDNALVPKDYRLGTGDELQIAFYGKETDNYLLEIGREGEVQLPKVGPLVLAGLQFEDARDLIQRQVQERLIGVDAVVTMGRMRAISVFMAGELKVPGSYSVSALSTVSQALFVAGGVSPIGTLRNIQVKRAGRTIAVFDTYDLLLRGDIDQDVRLQSGDVVFVPPYDRLATITGEVKRPMAYELADNETAANAKFQLTKECIR
jgi:polysaccharide export outer membrane protein